MRTVDEYLKNRSLLIDGGAYSEDMEHDACGVGLVCETQKSATRRVVLQALEALKSLWHRGAVDADGKTGDGAGILLEIPEQFFDQVLETLGRPARKGQLAVGMVFLPRLDAEKQETCRTVIESEIARRGFSLLGWRQVPVDLSVIGEKANHTRPEIEQVLLSGPPQLKGDELERELFLIRKSIEKRIASENIEDFYVCSFSSRNIVYKGMFLAEQLGAFYPDLLDDNFLSRYAIYHQRYSTNTFPRWSLAQPFRMLAHNGEINTIRGNLNWLRVQEEKMSHDFFAKDSKLIKPVVAHRSSDSAALDNVFELLVQAGKTAPLAKSLLIPEAWRKNPDISDQLADFYTYCNAQMKPWDGPAAIVACDGHWAVAGLDRSGLRPLRYLKTKDGLLIAGSETGMVSVRESEVLQKGRMGPGEMIAIHFDAAGDQQSFFNSTEIKEHLASSAPFKDYIKDFRPFEDLKKSAPVYQPVVESLQRSLRLFGYTHETISKVLRPMANLGKEPIGSMGDDAALAVFSSHYRGLHHFFRQNFAQVTNPPLDSLREDRVMGLTTRLGNLVNVLDTDNIRQEVLLLKSPMLSNSDLATLKHYSKSNAEVLSTLYDPKKKSLKQAIDELQEKSLSLARQGKAHIFLSDEGADFHLAPVPAVLAVGAVHTYLIQHGTRSQVSLHAIVGECFDTHCAAVLIGIGATTVCPYLAEEAIRNEFQKEHLDVPSEEEAVNNFRKSFDAGLLKIMSKIGVSVISSYRGGYQFEVLGLSRSIMDEYFPGMQSKLSGYDLSDLEERWKFHVESCLASASLPIGGYYHWRARGEVHSLDGGAVHALQQATAKGSYTLYKKFTKIVENREPVFIRDLLRTRSDRAKSGEPSGSEDSITSIRRRFISPGMSHGALSSEAHETLAIAMNRMGARSVSGEGGEDPVRFSRFANGDYACSAIKQVASGRFGVTAEYLNQCEEIEIKVAQGAKPGEGGQLPGFKVTAEIARLRHSTEGVSLISPPPHHDIYSIEDLAQLIFDLKQINPRARVCVKLVAKSGIGTIAAGVAKAKADVILVSGHSGGTGASAQSSICHAGMPWELGLSEVHQVLTLNDLREKVTLRVDGGIKTGRDVVIAALLGAEEFGIGTAALVAMGCLLVRQCQSNVCPVGICTQRPELRKLFDGTPEKVINLFSFIAEDVYDQIVELGYSSLDEIVGRTDLLVRKETENPGAKRLDLNPLFIKLDNFNQPKGQKQPQMVSNDLDEKIVEDAAPFFSEGERMELTYQIQNTDRSVGTRVSHHIYKSKVGKSLARGHLTVKLRGSAGQSLGAFAVPGLKLIVYGDANDYVGKGLCGGEIVVHPFASAEFHSHENAIVGNTVLYGATSGQLFAAGQAGERFSVRNSGARAVVEGCGANGCEYMTGGTVVILGTVGDNFAAGMTGGMAFVYDAENTFSSRLNPETVVFQRIENSYWEAQCRELIEEHIEQTGSKFAENLLRNWDEHRGHFWQVCPKEMVHRLSHPLSAHESGVVDSL